MSDETLEPEGSIEIKTSRDGAEAQVTLYFTFEGDWSNMYHNIPEDEATARQWFIHEVQWALEAKRIEASKSLQAERPSDTQSGGE